MDVTTPGVAQKYPPAWSGLRFPWQRAELLAYLGDAQKPSAHEDFDEMKSLTNFVFDDHDFNPSSQQLGLTLLDQDEVAVVAAFVEALDCTLGSRRKPFSEITAEEWALVSTAAARARVCLLRQGQSWFED